MKKILLCSIVCTLQFCTEIRIDNSSPDDDPWGFVSANYVTAYIYPDTVSVGYHIDEIDSFSTGKLERPVKTLVIGLSFPVEEDVVLRDRLYSGETWYDQEKVNKFKELAKANKDTSYNRSGIFGGCLADAVESINIISNSDYDEEHPAGTLLNDLIDIRFRSAKEFIESGYTDKRYDPKAAYSVSFQIEPLPQFNEEKRNLLWYGFGFIFRKLPDKSKVHNFTIYYNDVAGRQLEISVESVIIEE